DADLVLVAPSIGGVRYDELGARIAVADGRAELHGRLAQSAGRALVLDGATPVRWRLQPWQLEGSGALTGRLRSDGIDLAFVTALAPGLVRKVGGTLSGEVELGGTLAQPEARGEIGLAGARAYV